MVTGGRSLISIGCKYNAWKVLFFIVTENAGIAKAVFTVYLSTLTSFLMLPSALLIAPLSCISYLDHLMKLNPTTNQGSII